MANSDDEKSKGSDLLLRQDDQSALAKDDAPSRNSEGEEGMENPSPPVPDGAGEENQQSQAMERVSLLLPSFLEDFPDESIPKEVDHRCNRRLGFFEGINKIVEDSLNEMNKTGAINSPSGEDDPQS